MTSPLTQAVGARLSLSHGDPERPANLEQAAQSFEALLVGQMLKMVRESSQGGGLGESDGASSSVYEMAEENLAKELTRNGGLGLAKLIARQLSQPSHKLNDSEVPSPASSAP